MSVDSLPVSNSSTEPGTTTPADPSVVNVPTEGAAEQPAEGATELPTEQPTEQTLPIAVEPVTTEPLISEPVTAEQAVDKPVIDVPETVDPTRQELFQKDGIVADGLTGEPMVMAVAMPMMVAGMPREIMPNARNLNQGLNGGSKRAPIDYSLGGKSARLQIIAQQKPNGAGRIPIAIASIQRNLLSASPTAQKGLFQWKALSDSLMYGRRGLMRWDVVTGFDSQRHALLAPRSVNKTIIKATSGRINQLNPEQVNGKGVGGALLKANSAAAFTCQGFDGTFVVFNDARPGYQANSDALIFLENHQFNLGTTININ